MSLQLERVIQEIRNERLRQDTQWGGPERDDAHSLSYFLETIEQKYCRQAMMALLEDDLLEFRRHLIQMTALCTAAVESLDRRMAGSNPLGTLPGIEVEPFKDGIVDDPENP